MKKFCTIACCMLFAVVSTAQSIVTEKSSAATFSLDNTTICVDTEDAEVVQLAAGLLQKDIESITGKNPSLAAGPSALSKNIIIIGSIEKSALIRQLIQQKKIAVTSLQGQWEGYQIQTIHNPMKGVENALVITGSDRRGTAFGVFELSKQIGVSPWYWWADVPVKKKKALYIKKGIKLQDAPKVKYRGIFINDEAPALSNWSRSAFGGFNHSFYEKVFELMLRLKSNYIWPAMWGNAFYYDDSLNIKSADKYAIVIGTSHHEPLMRAHEEWKYLGKGRKWNYDSTEAGLKEFWRGGMQRATNEKIVSVGMRGDGDEPMSRETATALLERIVKDQRTIIEEVTGKPANQTPQLWALYKEVQDYYDKGMRVPDDVTLLLCDDNWGNIRKLPNPDSYREDDKPRKGGYGIYYHFDYVGGPRNYKWINTNPLPRIWEQMHLAWEYKAREIWIVNVGDIKPMEFPISFFLDYAWNPERIGPADLQQYSKQWAASQFGEKYANEIADILAKYAKYNSRRKPELLDESTFNLEFYEFPGVVAEYNQLLAKAEKIRPLLSPDQQSAYFQLVLHPVKAMANLYAMYYYVALNKRALKNKYAVASVYARKAEELFQKDSLITLEYHRLNNGKWNHMMSQIHIGYTNWQQPRIQKMPLVKYASADSNWLNFTDYDSAGNGLTYHQSEVIKGKPVSHFHDKFYSFNAEKFDKAVNTNGITWTILPDHGRTGSAVTAFPVTATAQKPGSNSPHLQYNFHTYAEASDSFTIQAYFSPTLNFHNTEKGLQYAISIDDETPQIISINAEDKNTGRGIWNKWVSENIIIKTSNHKISTPGKHTVKYWMVNSGVVLQKLVLDFGGVKQSYLGPPETSVIK